MDAIRSRLHGLAAAVMAVTLAASCGIAAQSPSPIPTAAPAAGPTGTPGATATAGPTGGPTEAPTDTPEPTPVPSPAGQLNFANWPLYIDIDEDTGGYPTLESFESATGIDVTYVEAINDNEEFFGRILPDLAAGRSTGWDIIVMTDWMIERLIRLGYLEELDQSMLPNFHANAEEFFTDSWYDPGNRYSLPWQSGIVGIGYNPTLTGREITSFDDLLDPAFAGRVGMFSEMRDTMSLALLSIGVVPEEATIEDVEAAQAKLLEAAERGQFRAFYGNDYYDALAAGDVALSIAWSGDVSQMKLYDNPEVEFVVPEEGGMVFVDSMAIPKNAEHPIDAHMMMDYWYDVETATTLTEYIGYFSPVSGVRDLILQHSEEARAEGDSEWADQLLVIADTSYPSDDQLVNIYTYKILNEQEERVWNDLFNEVVSG